MHQNLTSIARTLAFSLIILSLVILPTALGKTSKAPPAARAMMCACCADAGEWYQQAERITAEMRKEINRVKFYEATNGMSGMEDAPFSDGKFELTRSNDARWQLKYSGAQGKNGSLSLPVPIRLVNFGADVRDGHQGGGGGPLLYKEWRFEGAGIGTGVFKSWRMKIPSRSPGTRKSLHASRRLQTLEPVSQSRIDVAVVLRLGESVTPSTQKYESHRAIRPTLPLWSSGSRLVTTGRNGVTKRIRVARAGTRRSWN